MRLTRLLPSRIALRIYLVGLAQMAIVALGFFALIIANRPVGTGPYRSQASYVAATLGHTLSDSARLQSEVERVRAELRAEVTVIDPDGLVIAPRAAPASPRCAVGVEPTMRGERPCLALTVPFPDGRAGVVEYVPPPRPPSPWGLRVIALVLVVVGVTSWLLARSMTQPISRLASVASAIGGGDLTARAGLERRDELGDLSRSFDTMAEQLSDLMRAEKELLANVSHELRTPLARIRVALDIANEGDAEVARESLGDIAGDLDELERLIADVLTAARLDLGDGSNMRGIPPLRRQDFESIDIIEQASQRFRTAHPTRALRTELAQALPVIHGDPVLLRRALDNLLENAQKYSAPGSGPVELRAGIARQGGRVELTIDVVDHGVGIAAADLARVFQPFFRADKSRTRATGGLGLGLALTKRIIEAHEGRIELSSVLGEGTTVGVRIPASVPSTPS